MGSASNESVVEEIKRRLSIIDLIQRYVSLKRVGKSYVGLCPFHDDTNPSLHVSEEKGLFHCFSCGAGGDIFGFVMKYQNVSFPEALVELARIANVELKENRGEASSALLSKKKRLIKLNNLVSEFYHRKLFKDKEAECARNYLKERGISSEVARVFRLGYAPSKYSSLYHYLKSKDLSIKDAEELGLLAKKASGDYYDRFRSRIIFPIRDVLGDVIGFGGRIVKNEGFPKYYNSPESVLYQKRNTLYGINVALPFIRKEKSVFVVEGYFDLISLYASGISNVVSTLGTSFTSNHAKILKRYTDNTFILFDGDEAGMSSSVRAGEVLLQEGIIPRIIRLPHGQDPDSFVREKGPEAILELVSKSKSFVDYAFDITFDKLQKGQISRDAAATDVAKIISKIGSVVEQTYYVSKASSIFGFRESDIYSLVKRLTKLVDSSGKQFPAVQKRSSNALEILILKIICKYPEFSDIIFENEVMELIKDGDVRDAIAMISKEEGKSISHIIAKCENPKIQSLISEAFFSLDPISDRDSAFLMLKHSIARLKIKKINNELLLVRKKIEEAKKSGNFEEEKQLLGHYQGLVKKEKILRGELNEP